MALIAEDGYFFLRWCIPQQTNAAALFENYLIAANYSTGFIGGFANNILKLKPGIDG